MAIFGFFCLLLIAMMVTAGVLAGMSASLGFSGKVEGGLWVLAAFAAILWFGVYHFFPFSITILTP